MRIIDCKSYFQKYFYDDIRDFNYSPSEIYNFTNKILISHIFIIYLFQYSFPISLLVIIYLKLDCQTEVKIKCERKNQNILSDSASPVVLI